MSLINEALKKAQRQRTEDPVFVPPGSPLASGGGSGSGGAPRIPKRRPPMPARTLILLIGGSALLVMAGLLGFVMLHEEAPLPPLNRPVARATPAQDITDAPLGTALTHSGKVVNATPPPVVLPSSTVPSPAPVAVATTASTHASSPAPAPATSAAPAVTAFNPVPATTRSPAPTAAPVPTVAEVRLPAVVVPPAATPVPTQPPTVEVFNRPVAPPRANGIPSLAPAPNPRVYEFLEALKITGIRVSETDPKVIMNDRVFRLNDLVDKATQLRLTKVTSSGLTFVDVNGVEYQKTF